MLQKKVISRQEMSSIFLKGRPVLSTRTPGVPDAKVNAFISKDVAKSFDIYETTSNKITALV
jgi:hypothetical protein